MKHIYKLASLLLLIISSYSCKRFVQIPNAPNKLSTAAVFADSADATSAVLGMYINSMSSPSPVFLNGAITLDCALAADELYPSNDAYSSDDLEFYANAVGATTNSSNTINWQAGYINIYQANACIEGVEGSAGISKSAKNQLEGESKFFRALNYFNLVNLFGDVPIITSTQYEHNATVPRSSTDSVYALIVADLTDAESLLQASYPSAQRVRPNKYTATALLARVYLFLKQWKNAQDAADRIINSNVYTLETDLNNVFLATSNEAIWQLIPVNNQGNETAEGYAIIPTDPTVIPTYSLSDFLLNDFEAGDTRRLKWVDSSMVDGSTYFYPYKYKLGYDGNSTPVENYMMFRLAEQYLIRAEAKAELSDLGGAISDLNMVRARSGLGGVNVSGQTDLLTAVYHERRIELFCELGLRWYDLKRTAKADEVMGVVTPAKGGIWNHNWQLFPVPYSELLLNPFLKQNQGYSN